MSTLTIVLNQFLADCTSAHWTSSRQRTVEVRPFRRRIRPTLEDFIIDVEQSGGFHLDAPPSPAALMIGIKTFDVPKRRSMKEQAIHFLCK